MPSPGQVKTTHLNPALKSALACLDLNLDTELRRYRRACRKLGKVLSPPSHSGGIALPQQSLIDLKSITDFIPLEKPAEDRKVSLVSFDRTDTAKGSQTQGSEAIADRQAHQQGSSSSSKSEQKSVATLVYQNPKDLTPPPAPEPPTDYLRSSEQLLESIYDQDSSGSAQGSTGEKTSSLDADPLHPSPSPGAGTASTDEEKQHNWSEELFTPLGFSAIALAMASGGLLAWSLLVPPPASDSQEMTAIDNSVVINPEAVAPVTTESNLALGLDLSAPEELVTIDFNNLPNLDPQLPATVNNPVNIPEELRTSPSNHTASNQAANPSTPAPKPLVTIPTPVAPTPPNLLSALLPPELRPQVETDGISTPALPSQGQALYLVVLAYNNEEQLAQVRTVSKQAFVKKLPEGNFIQIAAFDNPKEAQVYGTNLSFEGVKPIVYTLRK